MMDRNDEMSAPNYPSQRSVVAVTFTDGEVKTYAISAGASIAGYLMRSASDTGIVTLRDDLAGTAVCVPLDRVRDIQFTPAPAAEEAPA
mgnify:FL=1|tara:strand:- start:1106 stop:1372 length:267 start_codon:yes stop_codon:yes gene_type:complete